MQRIVSVSRRTDIPAFYGKWFANRLDAGFVGWVNPFGGQKYLVSLHPEDVTALVFWSKNYRPFLEFLPDLKQRGYNCLFHYTITGLPGMFETNPVETGDAIDSFRQISDLYSPEHIAWRFDPILISDVTDKEFHLDRFEYIASRLSGYTERCFVSFAVYYGKVERSFRNFTAHHGINFFDPAREEKIELADQLAGIAGHYGIQMFSCCGDYLVNDRINKGRCIDGELISRLFYKGNWKGKSKPTRRECGCTQSTDIGKYDTCPHGCIYCYANMNKETARDVYEKHDGDSPFLGYAREEGNRFLSELGNEHDN